MGLSTTYTKAETDFLLQQIDKKVVGGYKGDLRISDTAPTGIGYYMLLDVGTYTNLGGINATAGNLNFASFDGTTWSKVDVTNFQLSMNVNSVEKTKGVTGEAVYDFLKKEVVTINLFNKKTFKPGYAFSTTNGSVVQMNARNGISELIPVDGDSLYGTVQIGANDSNITVLVIVEYDENKTYIGWQNAQSKATIKTGENTRFVRINPNSAIENFDFWMDNFIFSKVENFPIKFMDYGETEKQIFQNDLSFFEKHNFYEVNTLTTEGVTFQNETLKITTGEKNFYSQQIFLFATLLKYSGNAVVVTKLKGNFQEFLPYFVDNYLTYTTTDNLEGEISFFYGSNSDEFFIVTKNYFNKNNFFVFVKNMRNSGNIQTEINIKIEQFILYLDANGKPRNLDGASVEQLNILSQQIQSLSSSVPQTIDNKISSQVPTIINQQIGSNINDYLANHINDFTFTQPNYIQANSAFNLSGLTPAMNGKFISIIEDIDLQGQTIDFVAQGVKDLKLVFNGGRILNGKIRSNNTHCIFNSNAAFVNVEILNQFNNDFALPEWFGAKIDGQDGGIGNFSKDDSFAMNQALKFASLVKLAGNRTMIIKKPIIVRTGNTIEADRNFEIKLGDGANCTLLKNEHIDIPHDAVNPVVYPQGFKRNKNITIRGGIWNGNGLKQNRADNPSVGDQPDVIGTQRFSDGDTLNYVGFMMKFADIDDFLMENLTLKNGRTYMVAAGGLTNYVFQNITMIRTHYIENGDGIHLHGHCYSGIIQDIKGQSGDDFVAVTTSEAQRLSMRVGDVVGLKIRNLYHYGLVAGATISNPQEMTNGIPPLTKTKRCVRLTYTDNVIDDVTVENVRQYNGDFMVLVVIAYLHLPDFNGTNGKVGSVVVKGLKDNNGCAAISVGANTKVDHITLKDVYIKLEDTVEIPALLRHTDNFGGADQLALTEVGTVVIDNVYFLKGNTLYASADGLVWMLGKLKNLFINNLIVETKSGSSKINALFSGRIDNVSITNSNIDVTEINSTNGNATTNLTFRESNNEFNSAVMGVIPKRVITESIVLSSNPTNPKMGDKILKSDGIYLYTTSWNKI